MKSTRHHWLPQFYLRHFATPESVHAKNRQVWVYRRGDAQPFLTNTKNIGLEAGLYSSSADTADHCYIESEKLAEIESVYAQFWDGLDSTRPPNIDSIQTRENIAAYIALQMYRNPLWRDLYVASQARLIRSLSKQPRGSDGTPIVLVPDQGKQRRLTADEWYQLTHPDAGAIQDGYVRGLVSNIIMEARAILVAKNWQVVVSEVDGFVTSDNPVILVNTQRPQHEWPRLSDPETIVLFPLTPRYALSMYSQPLALRYKLYNHHMTAGVNAQVWATTKRFMISHRNPDLVHDEIGAYLQAITAKPDDK